MIGLDTNVLARYFVEEAVADAATHRQREAARELIESGRDLFLPKTVALELEWVLRGYYGFGVDQVLQVLDQLLVHASLEVEDRPALEQAVAGLRAGLDFADALHHASCRTCETIASFDDRGFARRIRQLNLPPRVVVPSLPPAQLQVLRDLGVADWL
ncbi:MAG: type II toxin-antitoxin system VapC family toxin [Synechococcaceae cyanobacterium]